VATQALPAMAGMVSTPRPRTMPLTFVESGEVATIDALRGGPGLRRRLIDLGLHPGASIRMIKNDGPGPLIVAAKEDSRLALGRGMAHHILVHITNNPPR
jgi:ferrous iron transport protein A